MRKLLILITVLLSISSVCFADGIKHDKDDFTGRASHYINYKTNSNPFDFVLMTTFMATDVGKELTSKSLMINFMSDTVYSISQNINIKIGNLIYIVKTNTLSGRDSDTTYQTWVFDQKILDAFMSATSDIEIRFYYSTLSGSYYKDYKIPYKTVKEVQNLYLTYDEVKGELN